jgi:hypothetical protein
MRADSQSQLSPGRFFGLDAELPARGKNVFGVRVFFAVVVIRVAAGCQRHVEHVFFAAAQDRQHPVRRDF